MNTDALRRAELFEGMDADQAALLQGVARPRTLRQGECLFLLGDHANELYVVLSGRAELTFPLSFGDAMRDVCVESKLPGSVLGWSALVKPYRFTLSARAVEPCELAALARQDLLRLFEGDTRIGCAFMKNFSTIVGHRLLHVQAMWAREIQRAVTRVYEAPQVPPEGKL